MRVAAVQYELRSIKAFEEFAHQVEYFVDAVADYKADFVVFPELFTLQLLSIENRKVPAAEANRILTALGFETRLDGETIHAVVPPWRPDIDGEADLVEEVLRIAGYAEKIAAQAESLAAYRAQSLWLDESLTGRAARVLAGTAAAIVNLAERTRLARDGFLNLPRLPQDNGVMPEPVVHEPLVET